MRVTPIVAVLIVPTVAQANAQESFFERNRYTAVTERSQPEFDPVSVRVGAFDVQPELGLEAGYRSNLFATNTNEVDDTFIQVDPVVAARSNWSRHELSARIAASSVNYSDTGSEDYTNFGADAAGRLDLGTATNLTGTIGYENNNEPRSAAATVPNASKPVEYTKFGGSAGIEHDMGRIQLRGRISSNDYNYDDVSLIGGGTQDQDYRDHTENELYARASWAVERDWAVFAEGSVVDRSYDQQVVGQPNRDTEGLIGRVGVNFELPQLIRGDIAVGYQSFDYDDPTISDVDGLSVNATAQWFVTQLTTVTGAAERRVVDYGIINSPGTVFTGVSVGVDHELKRNIVIGGRLGVENYDFQNVNRSDDRISVGGNATYKLNRNVWLNSRAEYIDQDSNVQPFKDTRVLIGLTLFP